MEIARFQVKRQEDGWYIATHDGERGSVITEAQSLREIMDKAREALHLHYNGDSPRAMGFSTRIGTHGTPELVNIDRNSGVYAINHNGLSGSYKSPDDVLRALSQLSSKESKSFELVLEERL